MMNYENDNLQTLPVTQSNDVLSRTESLLAQVQANEVIISQGLDVANRVADVYAESQRLNAQVEMAREWSKVQVAKTAAKFYATKEIIERTFGERHEALSAHYRALDHAIEVGDRNLIVAAMHQIGTIVTSSPLADIQAFTARFEDTSMPLLDF